MQWKKVAITDNTNAKSKSENLSRKAVFCLFVYVNRSETHQKQMATHSPNLINDLNNYYQLMDNVNLTQHSA